MPHKKYPPGCTTFRRLPAFGREQEFFSAKRLVIIYNKNFVLILFYFYIEKLWVFGPLKFLKFFIVPIKREFFCLRPSEIFKIFACGAEEIKKLAYWLPNSKNFRFRRWKMEEIWLRGHQNFSKFSSAAQKIEEIWLRTSKILKIFWKKGLRLRGISGD